MSELLRTGKVASLIKETSETRRKIVELQNKEKQLVKEARETAAKSHTAQLAEAMHDKFCDKANRCEWSNEEFQSEYINGREQLKELTAEDIWELGAEHSNFLIQAEGVMRMKPYTEAMDELRR